MITIRTATEADIPLIGQLAKAAFYPTYLPFISLEQVDYMYRMMYSEASLQRQMSERGDVFLIAYDKETPVGYAAYQLGENGITKLHKIYVLPDVQVKGVGKLLLQTAEQNALSIGQQSLLLNVNRYNKAVGFYTHMGYSICAEDDIDIGNGYFMNDYEMIKSLK